MIQRSIDRRRSTQGGLVTSMVLHVGLVILLMFALQAGQGAIDDPVEELTKISYIEAKYGEDVASKVKLRMQPKSVPSKGRGIATKSAQKPKIESPKPVHSKESSGIEDVAAPVAAPIAAQVPQPKAAPRLSSKDMQEMATAIIPDDIQKRDASISADGDVPRLQSRSSTPDFKSPSASLSSRARSVDVAGTGAPMGETNRRSGGVAEGPTTNAPALQSRGGGPGTSGGGYAAPSSGLSSRGRAGGISDGTGTVPQSGGGSETGGRRTILDYGSGGGGLSSRGRSGGGLVESPKADIVKQEKSESSDIADAKPAKINANGASMTISGQIEGRKILYSVAPKYTKRAREQGWEGAVAVHFTVLADGRVKDNMYFEQTSAHRDLNKAAMEAIKQFKFAPLGPGRAAIEQWGVITIVFRLN